MPATPSSQPQPTVSPREVLLAAPATFYHGQTTVTTAGTQVVLAASQAIKYVLVKALQANSGLIYVGKSDVDSTNGFELSAREQVFIETDNLADVWIDAVVNGEGVSYEAS